MERVHFPRLHAGRAVDSDKEGQDQVTHTIENPVNTRVRIRQVAGNIGAEILGVDAAEDLSDDVIRELRQALLTHKVIFIRRQDLDYDRLVAFGKRFGTLTLGHPIYGGPEGKPLLREMDSRGEGTRANYWHADFTYMDNPPAFAFLHNVVCPEVGGDTIWANTGAAYRDLPEGLRTLADGLRVVHSNDSTSPTPPTTATCGPSTSRTASRPNTRPSGCTRKPASAACCWAGSRGLSPATPRRPAATCSGS